jgi:hypothetical protein
MKFYSGVTLYKALEALRDKAANYHSYIVEGAAN